MGFLNFWNKDKEAEFVELFVHGKSYKEIKKILNYPGNWDSLRKKADRMELERSSKYLDRQRRKAHKNYSINIDEEDESNHEVLIKRANASEIYKYAFSGIRDAIDQHFKKYKKDKVNFVGKYKKGKRVETANLFMSDSHFGQKNKIYHPRFQKEIETYNDDISGRMQSVFLSSIFEIVNLLEQGYYFEKLNIYLLGDLIEGDDYVFEGQHFSITKCVGLQMWDAVFRFTEMIRQLTRIFPKIEVICLVGNHSKPTSKRKAEMPVENYLEYHVYRAIELVFQDNKNVDIVVPTSRFYSTKVYDHLFFLTHGDYIRGFARSTRIRKVKDIYINLPDGFDVYGIGHYHSIDKDSVGDKGVLLTNGAWVPYDTYAQQLFGIYSEPKQWLVFSNKKRPITLSFELDFRGTKIQEGLIL